MNAVTISGSKAGGMHRGDGQSLLDWIKRKVSDLFVMSQYDAGDRTIVKGVKRNG